MLKKLFLPLLTLGLFGVSLLITNQAFALAKPTDPCAGMYWQAQESCQKGGDYAKYKTEKANWDTYCANSNIPLETRKNDGCEQAIKEWCQKALNYGQNIKSGVDYQNALNNCINNGGTMNTPGTTDYGRTKTGGKTDIGDIEVPSAGTGEDGTVGAATLQIANEYKEGYKLGEAPEGLKSRCMSFAGMVSWDCGIDFENDTSSEEGLFNIVITIAGNIFTDITVLASYLVIAYIIYGGYLYIFANGDTGKVANGKRALNQAFIGLAITLSANIIINAIRVALLHNNGTFANCVTEECATADDLITNLIQWVVGIGGAVAAAFVVGGGIMYITSAGDPNRLQTAKNIIKYALIGLVIVALAEVITGFMSNIIVDAKKNSTPAEESYIINTKETYEKIS